MAHVGTGASHRGAQLAGWAAPCLPLAAIGLPLAVYLPHYYASVIGVDLGLVGAAFLAVRCLDIGVDPLVGWAMDRTRNRLGPYRTWSILGVPILALGVWGVFMARPGSGAPGLTAWLFVLYVGFSIATLAQLAWGAVLAPGYRARARLYGWWQAGNIVGVLIALLIPVLVTRLSHGGEAVGMRAMGLTIIVALPLSLLFALWRTPEPQAPPASPGRTLAALLSLIGRPTLRRLVLCDLLLGVAPGLIGVLLFYYFGFIKGFSQAQSQVLMVIYFVGGLLAAPLWGWIAGRLGKASTLQLASGLFALMLVGVGLLPHGDMTTAAVMLFLAGLPYAAGLLLTRAMMADVADEVRLETGEDRTGLLFSLLSSTTKLGSALSVGSLALLQASGFHQHGPNAPLALATLQGLFVAAPILLLIAAAAAVHRYPLTAARHAAIRQALEAQTNGA